MPSASAQQMSQLQYVWDWGTEEQAVYHTGSVSACSFSAFHKEACWSASHETCCKRASGAALRTRDCLGLGVRVSLHGACEWFSCQ